jgi:hypothetical protein
LEECKANRSHLLLHRLYDCPRFAAVREQFINDCGAPDGSTLEQFMPTILLEKKLIEGLCKLIKDII